MKTIAPFLRVGSGMDDDVRGVFRFGVKIRDTTCIWVQYTTSICDTCNLSCVGENCLVSVNSFEVDYTTHIWQSSYVSERTMQIYHSGRFVDFLVM